MFRKGEKAMKEKLAEIKKQAMKALDSETVLKGLEDIRVQYLGKKGELTGVLRGMKDVSAEERPVIGQIANEVREVLEELIESKKEALEKLMQDKRLEKEVIDITLPGKKNQIGHMHPIQTTLEEVQNIFLGMGYEIVDGREVETGYYNFDALNLGADHPARDEQDTFYMSKDITFGDLKGALAEFAKALFGDKAQVKFRPHYFPFTEPSAEVDVSCVMCGGKGCSVCKGTGWIEILGCGMVHPKVLEMAGIDPEVYSGFAFGMGLERITMLKYNIHDLRLFYENDVRFISQF